MASDAIQTYSRETYDLFEWLSDVGGLYGVIYGVLALFITRFSHTKIYGLMANTFYTWYTPEAYG
jgi:hypothetical protein